MSLPSEILQRIHTLLSNASNESSLQSARQQLTERYRSHETAIQFDSPQERLSYIATRLPATHAVTLNILQELNVAPTTFLDLGAGPGTGLLAAIQVWPHLQKATLLEKDAGMIDLGQQLLEGLTTFEYLQEDARTFAIPNPYDLVLISYMLNELDIQTQQIVIEKAWRATRQTLVLIVPGTPLAYQQLMQHRDTLIQAGGHIAAPCPHHAKCPLLERERDWCHFSVRLPRSSWHRRIKTADLVYEDEKFSYLVVSKTPTSASQARIIKKPQKHVGHVMLDLCQQDGSYQRVTISKRDKSLYKQASKKTWGEGWKDL
jgi:ribosomal protein RSM22 (predicted rRNA methylase)